MAGAQRGMLVVSCALPSATKEALETQHSLTLVDRFDLFAWAAAKPWLLEELESVLEVDSRQTFDLSRAKTEWPGIGDRPLSREAPPEDRRGSELVTQLKSLKRGKPAWVAYEALCDKILRYLFPNDLHGWHKQRRTDDGLNRFDYVCRIKPATEFWQFLIDHLNSRYVLFEFKNHAGKIKQGQILTTEKYLLDKGLRRVALILSRAGADESATAMAQGAMREHGKLILVLDDAQVIEMLRGKERGDDPTDLLFNLADDFLLKLPR